MATERIGRAVLELSTDSTGFLQDLKKVHAESLNLDGEFDALRKRVQKLGPDMQAAFGSPGAAVEGLRAKVKGLGDDSAKAGGGGGVGSLTGALGGLSKLIPALSATAVVGGIVAIGKSAFDSADRIVTLSDKLGVSTETIQRWQYVAGQTGTEVEAFGTAAYKLGINLSEGTEKARKATADLGLAYADLKAMKPEQQFDVVMAKLEGVESATERNRIGQALFGKTFSEVSSAVGAGYTRLAKEATVASDDQVRALEAAGDAWDKLKKKIGAVSIGVLGGAAQQGFDIASAWRVAWGGMAQYTAEQQKKIQDTISSGGHGLAAMLDEYDRAKTRDIEITGDGAKATENYTQKMAAARAEIAKLRKEHGAEIDAALELDGATQDVADAFNTTIEILKLYQSTSRDAITTTKAHAKAQKDFLDSIKSVQVAMKGYLTLPPVVEDSSKEIGELRESMDAMAGISFNTTWLPFQKGVKDSRVGIHAMRTEIDRLAPAILGAFQGGGSVSKTIGGLLGGSLFGKGEEGLFGGALNKSITGGITKLFGAGKLGSMLGSLVPGLGTLAGGALGSLLGKGLGKLFGGGEGKKVNDLRDEFVKAAGGIGQLDAKAHAAGLTLDRLLRAKTVKDYEAAIGELNKAFEDQQRILEENTAKASDLFDEIMTAGSEGIPAAYRPAIDQLIALGLLTDEQAEKLRGLGDSGAVNVDKMKSALDVFKGRVESLGPAFKQAEINKTATEYINAIETMTKGGGDLGMILEDSKEELSALVSDALKSGKTLPANMQPWIDQLFRQGDLIDANGKKITDLSGLKYGDAIETEGQKAQHTWDEILLAIQALVDRITGPLTAAITNLPDGHVKINVDSSDLDRVGRGDYRSREHGGDLGFASGVFRGSFAPLGTRALLHNVESVVPATPSAELGFAARVLAERGGHAVTTTNNATGIIGIIMGQGLSPWEIGRQATSYLAKQGLPNNTEGVARSVERLVDAYIRNSYAGAASGNR